MYTVIMLVIEFDKIVCRSGESGVVERGAGSGGGLEEGEGTVISTEEDELVMVVVEPAA